MMESVDAVNEAQKDVLVQKIRKHFTASSQGKTIAVWGLAFKPRTDDIREAPALVADRRPARRRALSSASTIPRRSPTSAQIYGDRLAYCDRPYGCLEQADALAIVTEWNEFRNPDFEVMRRLMQAAGHLRRPQPLRPDAHGRPGLHLPRASAAPGAGGCRGLIEFPSARPTACDTCPIVDRSLCSDDRGRLLPRRPGRSRGRDGEREHWPSWVPGSGQLGGGLRAAAGEGELGRNPEARGRAGPEGRAGGGQAPRALRRGQPARRFEPGDRRVAHLRRQATPAAFHTEPVAWFTADGGATWTAAEIAGAADLRRETSYFADAYATFAPDGTAFYSFLGSPKGDRLNLYVYRSDDGGRRWQGPTTLGTGFDYSRLVADMYNGKPRLFVAVAIDGDRPMLGTLKKPGTYGFAVLRSDNGATTFAAVGFLAPTTMSHDPIDSPIVLPDGRLLVAFCDYPTFPSGDKPREQALWVARIPRRRRTAGRPSRPPRRSVTASSTTVSSRSPPTSPTARARVGSTR